MISLAQSKDIAGEHPRKRIIINKNIQHKIASLPAMGILAAWLAIAATTVQFFYTEPAFSSPEIRHALVNMLFYNGACFTLIGIGMHIISLYFSHTLAGPLYRMEKVLDKVIAGDLSVRANFRDGDELQGLKNKFNRALSRIEAHNAPRRALQANASSVR